MEQQCLYVPGKPGIIDVFNGETGLGHYGGETLEQCRERYPGAQIGDFDTVIDEQEAYWIREPREITAEQFLEMLNILPPVGWTHDGAVETFKMSERTSGIVTGIYCRIGDDHYTLQDRITLSHEQICDKVCRWVEAAR